MHTHHSHSGDYVSHAVDTLEDMVKLYHEKKFSVVCLTEHMPRLDEKFLYPEELEKSYTTSNLNSDFDRYIKHATDLQSRYQDMKIIIGFEVEGINAEHIEYSQKLLDKVQMSVGSVHFVNEIPIDFSKELWLEARASTKENTTRALYRDYFELQHAVISRLQPTVVGHFDLIRLLQPEEDVDPSTGKLAKDVDLKNDWPEIWALIVRNIKLVKLYGGLFELNSSAIRKGWDTSYPKRDIAEAIIKHGGARFCLSDDAHALTQVGLNYDKTWKYVKSLGVTELYYLDATDGKVLIESESIEQLEKSPFWETI
ncbi:Histidinol-phosphatase [Candida viswanathii]|uniref:Histidinol-phosphatase n=1 Tax=Candida viswanathii TaxID=5486 RepID=A0A367YI98_9ASCO|nr:Histidinol-phosphatase [Candida viswanathii]